MATARLPQADIEAIQRCFPKLRSEIRDGQQAMVGIIDLSDSLGNYLAEVNVAVLVPESYPLGVPTLIERSTKLPRGEEDHINAQGVCCVDMDLDLEVRSRRGIKMVDFLLNWAYPFMVGVLHREAVGSYASGEYQHGAAGHFQRLRNLFVVADDTTVLQLLDAFQSANNMERNRPCWCGSGTKLKRCHWAATQWLNSLSAATLTKLTTELRTHLDNHKVAETK